MELGKQSWNVGEELWAGEMCAEAGIEAETEELGRFYRRGSRKKI